MRKLASKKDNSKSDYAGPHISEFERLALSILKEDGNKEQIKELLKKYAARYAEESTSGD